MRRRQVLRILGCLACGVQASPESDTLIARIRANIASVALPGGIEKIFNAQLPNGSWPDINYADHSQTVWSPATHTSRLLYTARAWAKPGSNWYQSDSMLRKITTGIEYYLAQNPYSTNWWWNDIGEDLDWGKVLVLIKGNVPDSLTRKWALRISGDWASWTGANLSWEGTAHLYRCLVRGDTNGVDSVIRRIRAEVRIVDSGDGIHSDYSFGQHSSYRNFPYNGGYGQAFLNEVLNWWKLMKDTKYEFSGLETQILDSLAMGGSSWFTYRQRWDPFVVGRNLARPYVLSSAELVASLKILRSVDPVNHDGMISWMEQKSSWPLRPDKVFWTCGALEHFGPSWKVSLRGVRRFETGTEFGNGENLKGWFLPFGSTWFQVRGDEYDLIWPLYDWAQIPGVTTEYVDTFPGQNKLNAYNYGNTDFVGGASNGSVSVFAYDYDVSSVTGKKAWFQTNDAFIALGSGFAYDSRRNVYTTLDQRWSKGDITICKRGKLGAMVSDSMVVDSASWIHHDQIGYQLLAPGKTVVKSILRRGSWRSIDTAFGDSASGQVFSLALDHGLKGASSSYAYVVVPGVSKESMSKWVSRSSVRILANTPRLQAIAQGGLTMAVFHAPDTLQVSKDSSIIVDRPCVVIRSETLGKVEWSIASPSRETGVLKMRILLPRDTVEKSFVLPSGGQAGATVGDVDLIPLRFTVPEHPRIHWQSNLLLYDSEQTVRASLFKVNGSQSNGWTLLNRGDQLSGAVPGDYFVVMDEKGSRSACLVPPRP